MSEKKHLAGLTYTVEEMHARPDPNDPAPERGVDPAFDTLADAAWAVIHGDPDGANITEQEARDTLASALRQHGARAKR